MFAITKSSTEPFKYNVISTPAYMITHDILEAEKGISKLVAEVVKRTS